ncbi:MAG: hypothetical protein ABI051_03360 [Vicinamibacterales bacterium]
MSIEIPMAMVVVVASAHNPSILHPSFLKAEGIVPADWEVIDEGLSTPALSKCGFSSGISFRCEPQRLIVKWDSLDPEIDSAKPVDVLPVVAAAYVAALPKVKYTGVGCNPIAFKEQGEAATYLLDRFVQPGAWNSGSQRPTDAELQFRYQRAGLNMRATLSAGTVTREVTRMEGETHTTVRHGILVRANYHIDVDGAETCLAAIGRFSELMTDFSSYVEKDLFGWQ